MIMITTTRILYRLWASRNNALCVPIFERPITLISFMSENGVYIHLHLKGYIHRTMQRNMLLLLLHIETEREMRETGGGIVSKRKKIREPSPSNSRPFFLFHIDCILQTEVLRVGALLQKLLFAYISLSNSHNSSLKEAKGVCYVL